MSNSPFFPDFTFKPLRDEVVYSLSDITESEIIKIDAIVSEAWINNELITTIVASIQENFKEGCSRFCIVSRTKIYNIFLSKINNYRFDLINEYQKHKVDINQINFITCNDMPILQEYDVLVLCRNYSDDYLQGKLIRLRTGRVYDRAVYNIDHECKK